MQQPLLDLEAVDDGAHPTLNARGLTRRSPKNKIAEVDSIDKDEFPSWFPVVYDGCLVRGKWAIITLWLLCLVWGMLTGGSYISRGQDEPHAPKGSRAESDLAVFTSRFPAQSNQETIIVLVRCRDDAPASCTAVCPQSECERSGSASCRGEHAALGKAVQRMSELVLEHADVVAGDLSYYNLTHSALNPVKCALASADGKATFVTYFLTPDSSTAERRKVISKLISTIIPQVNTETTSVMYTFGVTGFEALSKDGSESAVAQILKVDILALPLAFGILGYMLRSWRLLVLALMNTGVSVLTSFAFLCFYADVTGEKPLSTTASLVEVLGLAMSIDYSLFLLRRFRDEVKNGRSADMATRIMLLYAGHVVVLSSGTFALVFVGLIFLKSEDLSSLGRACTVTILIALVSCMTNTVALLAAFPHFFSAGIVPQPKTAWPAGVMAADALTLGTPPAPSSISPSRTVTGRLRYHRGAKYGGLYFEFLKRATKWPYNLVVVLVVYGLAVPLAMQVSRLKHNSDLLENIQRSAPSAKAFKQLVGAFPGGTLSPFYIIVAGPAAACDVQSPRDGPAVFALLNEVTQRAAKESAHDLKYFSSPALLQGHAVSYKQASALLDPTSRLCRTDASACALYQYSFAQSTSTLRDAAMITVIIPEDPYSSHGHALVDAIERVMDSVHVPEGYSLHLAGTVVTMYADMRGAFSALPLLYATTLVIIFALVGTGFRSAFVPIRLSLTVVMPLVVVFGLAVLVYQDGILDWMHVEAIESRYSKRGFFWYLPVITSLQGIGLCLDYDTFLGLRILEHRVHGYDIQAAIIKSIWEVNSQIVAAGTIMAIVFAGLLTGDSLSVNEFGFLLCTSVLVDTFIVQTLLVPAIFSFGDSFLWWPRRLVSEGLITLDDAEFATS